MPDSTPLLPEIAVANAWTTPVFLNTQVVKVTGVPTNELALWWQVFQDPQLDQLIAQALQANTDIAIAKAALLQARALRDVSLAGLLPRFDVAMTAQRNKNGDATPANSFSAGLDAAWEPDIFGGNHRAVEASESNLSAYTASLGDVQVSVAAEVALAYLQLRGTQARLQIAQANLRTQLETLQLTSWRVQAGLLTALEQEQAHAVSEQTSAQIPVLTTTIVQLAHSLAVLCGRAPQSLVTQLSAFVSTPRVRAELSVGIPAETLRQRPDVRAAEFQVNAAWARVMQADAALYPHFQISGSLGWRALTVSALGNSAALIAGIVANASFPLIEGASAGATSRLCTGTYVLSVGCAKCAQRSRRRLGGVVW